MNTLHDLLKQAILAGASDVHLSSNHAAIFRIDGELIPQGSTPLSSDEILHLLSEVMSQEQVTQLKQHVEVDFSFGIENVSRFRVNAFWQSHGVAAVLRAIPHHILTLDELGAPLVLKELVKLPRGLVIVTGPTGCGKSTTLASMLLEVSQQRACHILTIEDPIEYVHTSSKALISQREVGRDTKSFHVALRAALREDPDVLLVGEMRDLETIRLALTAAETGHLVFTTLHTSSAAKAMDRITDVFPAGEKELVRTLLSESLAAVISQVLVKKSHKGRVAAFEVMTATPAIRNLIREGKAAQLYSAIQTGTVHGMQTLDQSLQKLVKQGTISPQIAKKIAQSPDFSA